MIEIALGKSQQSLVIADPVVRHFEMHRQIGPYDSEAGGQLFARVSPLELYICEATGPRSTDRRGRFFYKPNRKSEQTEIQDRHLRALEYIGDWHTHPEEIPHPSGPDYFSMADCFTKSQHSLNAFVLIIVGNAELPESLHLSLHDQHGCLKELGVRSLPPGGRDADELPRSGGQIIRHKKAQPA